MTFIPARYTTTKSLLLNGSTQYVNIGNVAAMNFTGFTPFSITAWVKATSFSAANTIMSKYGGTLVGGWQFYTDGSGRLRLFLSNVTTMLFIRTNAGLSTGTWYHVAITYTGSGLASGVTFYINGAAQATTTITDTLSGSIANAANVFLGARDDASTYLPGNLYAVEPWNAALSGANITALYHAGVPIDSRLSAASANLISSYRCGNDPIDDATGTTGIIMDRVGGHPGTPIATVAGSIVTDAP